MRITINSHKKRYGQAKHFCIGISLWILLMHMVSCKSSEEKEKRIELGKELFQKSNCQMCHSFEGKDLYGPALNSILDTKVKVIRNNKEQYVTIDRKYIFRAIKDPEFEKLKGFEKRKMPVPDLSKSEMKAITEYIIFLNETKNN